MIIFSLIIVYTSQILCNEYTLTIWKNPQILRKWIGAKRLLEILCSAPWQPVVWEPVPSPSPLALLLGCGWFFNFPSLSPPLYSVNHGVIQPGEGGKPMVHGGTIPGLVWLTRCLSSASCPSLPRLLGFLAPPGNKPGSRFWFNKTKQGILGLTLGWPFTVLWLNCIFQWFCL